MYNIQYTIYYNTTMYILYLRLGQILLFAALRSLTMLHRMSRLVSRHWEIYEDGREEAERVDGDGVIGLFPILVDGGWLRNQESDPHGQYRDHGKADGFFRYQSCDLEFNFYIIYNRLTSFNTLTVNSIVAFIACYPTSAEALVGTVPWRVALVVL